MSPEGVEKRTDHSVRLEVRQLSESLMQQGTAPLIALLTIVSVKRCDN